MKSFIKYYGGKFQASKYYPKPLHDIIVEPFAGAAGYSTRYYDRKVILYDLDEKICAVWDYLINATPNDILSLPLEFDDVRETNISQEAQWLIGYWLNCGCRPKYKFSPWGKQKHNGFWSDLIRERLAKQCTLIKHWKIHNKSYENAPNIKATWFIDPPYNNAAGRVYTKKFDDYYGLAKFCKSRKGQTIVCENDGADWLDFKHLGEFQSANKKSSKEVIWINRQ